MPVEILEHSFKGWSEFAARAGFVPDPMILRTGEVFINGLSGTKALGRSDLEVWAALADNIGGLFDFFDLVVTRDRIPLIDYRYTFDVDSVSQPLELLLGHKAFPVMIAYGPYDVVKRGAFNCLAQIELSQVRAFGDQLRELDSLRYDWQPRLDDYQGKESWLSHSDRLDDHTARAARFLLGGFIFSGFAQASGTDHFIQPKRSRFFLSLTASSVTHHIGHDVEQPIFDEAIKKLNGTVATVHRLNALPPVLPYLMAMAPSDVTAAGILRLALAFPETPDGMRYCAAASSLRKDGIEAQKINDAALAAHKEALELITPFSRLADHDGGFQVEVSLGLDGPKIALSKQLRLPAWLRHWWNDQTPFGNMRKTFRRMWLDTDCYQQIQRQIRDIWARS
jgi:hypothetical protein